MLASLLRRFRKDWYPERDIMVDRVQEAKQSQQDAKEQFQSALEEFSAVANFQGSDLEDTYENSIKNYRKVKHVQMKLRQE